MQTPNNNLTRLQAVIIAELKNRIRHEPFTPEDITGWLITEHHAETMLALDDLVDRAICRYNDDLRVQGLIEKNPRLRAVVPLLRDVSDETGVGIAYLLARNVPDVLPLLQAVATIGEMRADEAQTEADSAQAEIDRLSPLWEKYPDMTTGEAMRELARQTDDTLRNLAGDC